MRWRIFYPRFPEEREREREREREKCGKIPDVTQSVSFSLKVDFFS